MPESLFKRSYGIVFYVSSACCYYFIQTGLHKRVFYIHFFGKPFFHLSVFSVFFSILCFELDVIFIDFFRLHNNCLYRCHVLWFCSHVDLWKHKNRVIKVWLLLKNIRSSRPEVLCKKVVLRNFTTFTEKHLCQGLFFNKVAGLFLQNTSGGYSCFL